MKLNIINQIGVSGAASTTGFAAAVAYAGGGYALSATAPTDGLGHLVTFLNKTATSHTGQTITFTGTNENGAAQTETITGPAGSATVTTTKYFKSLTSVTASATTGADTFDIGWALTSSMPWLQPYVLGTCPIVANLGLSISLITGSPTVTCEYTYDGITWFTITALSAKDATTDGGSFTIPVAALRMRFTAAGSMNFNLVSLVPQTGH